MNPNIGSLFQFQQAVTLGSAEIIVWQHAANSEDRSPRQKWAGYSEAGFQRASMTTVYM